MKSRWVALVLLVVAGVALFAAPASAAPAPPLVRCAFTPTPDNPAARPVVRPLPFALTRGTIDVTFRFNYGPVTL
ncbi:MAG: peptidylprolyl isomerase, partial [Actinomycetes bacterium]